MYTHIVDESVDVFVVAIAGPRSIVCATMEGLYVLHGGATHLRGAEGGTGGRERRMEREGMERGETRKEGKGEERGGEEREERGRGGRKAERERRRGRGGEGAKVTRTRTESSDNPENTNCSHVLLLNIYRYIMGTFLGVQMLPDTLPYIYVIRPL